MAEQTRLRRKRMLAAKVETTAGTAIALANADAAWNIFDAEIQQSIDFEPRESQGSFSHMPATPGGYAGSCKFSTEMITGTASLPRWASVLLPACGFVETSSVFNPVTAPPGVSGVKTVTIGLYEDGIFKSIRGAVGNAVFKFEAGKKTMIEFEFMGIWVPPTDVALLTPTYPTTAPLRFASSGLTIGSWTPRLKTLTLDLGNELFLREDSTDVSGFSTGIITGRRVNGKLDPEADVVANKDVYGDWLASTQAALAFTLASGAVSVAFAAPKLQFLNPQSAERNQLHIHDMEFQCNRSLDVGNDELSLTFDITA